MTGHVVLVGLMGSGKTTVGRRLARLLGRRFVDADEALEARERRSVAEIFAAQGEAAFRAAEAQALAELLASPEPTVIAAGGGVVVAPANRERLRDPGVTVVWLDAAPEFLAARVEPKPHRPLLTAGEPRETFARLHAQRAALYAEVADAVVAVEPFHQSEARPKRAIAEHIATLVARRERSLGPAAPR